MRAIVLGCMLTWLNSIFSMQNQRQKARRPRNQGEPSHPPQYGTFQNDGESSSVNTFSFMNFKFIDKLRHRLSTDSKIMDHHDLITLVILLQKPKAVLRSSHYDCWVLVCQELQSIILLKAINLYYLLPTLL